MRVLLDHNLPKRLKRDLAGHLVFTARSLGVDRLQNGDLLLFAEQQKFDVLITADQGIFYQQNNEKRRTALVVLTTNRRKPIEEYAERIVAAVAEATPGSFALVDIPLPAK